MLVESITDLAVSDEDNLGRGTLLVVCRDSLDNSSGTLRSRVVVADAAAVGLSTTSGVHDSLGASTGVGRLDRVDEASSSSIAVALWEGGLTSTEDVDLGACLPLGKFDGAGGNEASEEGSCSSDLHCVLDVRVVIEMSKEMPANYF
jgi:hypothetical protein